MKSILRVFALFAALAMGVLPAAHADGEVFYNATHNFGSAVWSSGSASFAYGGQGGPSMFSGGAFTSTGQSQLWGQSALQSQAFVPEGTVGTAQGSGSLSFSYDAMHNGSAFNANSVNVNTNSQSTGTGNANSMINHQGGTQQNTFQPTSSFGGGKG